MKNRFLCLSVFSAFLIVLFSSSSSSAGEVRGSFIQLNRETASRGTDYWNGVLAKMYKAGLSLAIIQWSSEDNIAYIKDSSLEQTEQYNTLDIILEAAQKVGMEIWLGLHNDQRFWMQIGARDKALREYFLVRVSQNEKIQKALLRKYGDNKTWKGYYIPDEIDDFTWREKSKMAAIREYLSLLISRIQANDSSGRLVAASAFFRPRTAPTVFAANLTDIVARTGLNIILIQDGRGTIYDTGSYVNEYFASLEKFANAKSMPETWCVVEIFEQTSAEGEPFSAKPASAEKVMEQISTAGKYFGNKIVVFSFIEYADPDKGTDHHKVYEVISGYKR